MQPSQFGLQPAIVVLKPGTDTSQGKGQLLTNIKACWNLAEILKTTLGPRGSDKLLVHGDISVISNDGATILQLLDVTHPAARILVDISKSVDIEVGDGTTSVCVLAGSFLKEAGKLVEQGVHPRIICRGYRECLQQCIARINEVQKPFDLQQNEHGEIPKETYDILIKLAGTAMNSKLIAPCREKFSKMVVDAILAVRAGSAILDMSNLGIKKVLGGGLEESELVKGIAFQKTFAYAGHEQQFKCGQNCKVLLLNFELEWAAEQNTELKLDNAQKFQDLVDAEYDIIYSKLKAIKESGATLVFSTKSVGDLATQYFADNGIFGAGRVAEEDMKRMSVQMDCPILQAVSDISSKVLGNCDHFEEKQVGAERYNFLTGFKTPLKACTIILRGGADQFLQESERSLHDSLMVVRRAVRSPAVIAGAGSIEMQLSQLLQRKSKTLTGKLQCVYEAFAKALEIIPKSLADNAGFDSTAIISKLRNEHYQALRQNEICWSGVDIKNDYSTIDAFKAYIWEPSAIRINALRSAVEASCTVLLVDMTFNLPSDTQNINQEKNKTAELKKKMNDAGLAPSVTASGKPSAALQAKMGKAVNKLK